MAHEDFNVAVAFVILPCKQQSFCSSIDRFALAKFLTKIDRSQCYIRAFAVTIILISVIKHSNSCVLELGDIFFEKNPSNPSYWYFGTLNTSKKVMFWNSSDFRVHTSPLKLTWFFPCWTESASFDFWRNIWKNFSFLSLNGNLSRWKHQTHH